ncbi:DNA repair protein RecN, partial [Mesorhizobium sp. M2E.F.Ca.ET.209.01.1.1]
LRDTMAADLADLDAGEERLHGLQKQAAAAREAYDISAAQLSSLRHAAAAGLTKAVMAELPALKLERAAFIVEMKSEAESRMEEGIDQIEFWVRTNPGTR